MGNVLWYFVAADPGCEVSLSAFAAQMVAVVAVKRVACRQHRYRSGATYLAHFKGHRFR
jgi:hypothetical protein